MQIVQNDSKIKVEGLVKESIAAFLEEVLDEILPLAQFDFHLKKKRQLQFFMSYIRYKNILYMKYIIREIIFVKRRMSIENSFSF